MRVTRLMFTIASANESCEKACEDSPFTKGFIRAGAKLMESSASRR